MLSHTMGSLVSKQGTSILKSHSIDFYFFFKLEKLGEERKIYTYMFCARNESLIYCVEL